MEENVTGSLSIGQLAKHWECARSYVSKCKSKGCPMDSFEAADRWRAKNSSRGIGYRSKGRAASPPEPSDPADSFLRKNSEGDSSGSEGAGQVPPKGRGDPLPRKKTKQLTTLESSLEASIEVESEALRLVQEAQRGREDEALPLRIAAYNKAKEGRMMTEKAVRAFDLESRTLITFAEAAEMATRFMVPMVTRLRSIPRRAGMLANPVDDVHAEAVISREIEKAIEEGQKLYEKAVDNGA